MKLMPDHDVAAAHTASKSKNLNAEAAKVQFAKGCKDDVNFMRITCAKLAKSPDQTNGQGFLFRYMETIY